MERLNLKVIIIKKISQIIRMRYKALELNRIKNIEIKTD